MMDIKQECPLHNSKLVMHHHCSFKVAWMKVFIASPAPTRRHRSTPVYMHTQHIPTTVCTHMHTRCFQVYTDKNPFVHFHTYIKSFALFFRTVFAQLEYTMPWRHETTRRRHKGRFLVISMGNHSVVFALLWWGGYNFKSPGKKIQDRKMAAYQTKKGSGWWAGKTSQKRGKTQTTHLVRTQSQNARTQLRFDLISACIRMWLTQLYSRKTRETPKETFFKGRHVGTESIPIPLILREANWKPRWWGWGMVPLVKCLLLQHGDQHLHQTKSWLGLLRCLGG